MQTDEVMTTNQTGAAALSYSQYPQSQGAYAQQPSQFASYQATPYATAVTSYGSWHYASYGYMHPPPHAYGARPPAATATAADNSALASQRFTFPAYRSQAAPLPSTTGRGPRKQSQFKGLFPKELKSLMYGFGDDRNPDADTVNLMEEILIEYICDLCQTAVGSSRKTRLSIEDLRRSLSLHPDAKKLARMEELLFMQEDIKRARLEFDDSELAQSKGF